MHVLVVLVTMSHHQFWVIESFKISYYVSLCYKLVSTLC
jgi:hypothetical protein